MDESNELIVVQVAPSLPAAELSLSILRSEGIKCASRASNRTAGAGDGLTSWGPHEVLVKRSDEEAARELLKDPDVAQ